MKKVKYFFSIWFARSRVIQFFLVLVLNFFARFSSFRRFLFEDLRFVKNDWACMLCVCVCDFFDSIIGMHRHQFNRGIQICIQMIRKLFSHYLIFLLVCVLLGCMHHKAKTAFKTPKTPTISNHTQIHFFLWSQKIKYLWKCVKFWIFFSAQQSVKNLLRPQILIETKMIKYVNE